MSDDPPLGKLPAVNASACDFNDPHMNAIVANRAAGELAEAIMRYRQHRDAAKFNILAGVRGSDERREIPYKPPMHEIPLQLLMDLQAMANELASRVEAGEMFTRPIAELINDMQTRGWTVTFPAFGNTRAMIVRATKGEVIVSHGYRLLQPGEFEVAVRRLHEQTVDPAEAT